MSTHIIDEIHAIRIPKELHGLSYRGDLFVICQLGGDNNVIHSTTNKRARSWNAVAIGEPWEVIRDVCKHAGSFEGGMMRFSSGRGTPEGYIRKVRKALADAATIGEGEVRVNLRIRFDDKEKVSADMEYKNLIITGAVPQKEAHFGEEEDVFHFHGKDSIRIWLKGVHGPAWRNVEVVGPRTV